MKTLPSVYGVGINDADYPISSYDDRGKRVNCPFYEKWKGIIQRCYCPKFHKDHPTYSTATIIEAWKTFSVFKAWMIQQKWEGLELDKDLLDYTNKVYGPNTCLFISVALNRLMNLRQNHRGKLSLGVRKSKSMLNPYMARCNFYGESKYLGSFPTEELAYAAYLLAKTEYITELADNEPDLIIKKALLKLGELSW